jgi:GNAT superfamily N-acetyltransferase
LDERSSAIDAFGTGDGLRLTSARLSAVAAGLHGMSRYARRMELRSAIVGDEEGVARVHVLAWQAGYRGLLPDAYLDALRFEDRAARYTFGWRDGPQTTIAVRDDEIVGFATISGSELSALYVHPSVWRSGVGTALITDARKRMAATGESEARLWLLDGNSRGLSFYVRDGWRLDGSRRTAMLWETHVDETSLRRAM